jgi:hypothetical protein
MPASAALPRPKKLRALTLILSVETTMSAIKLLVRRTARCAAIALLAAPAAAAAAQSISLPAFDAGAFNTAFDLTGDGRLVAYTGDNVFVQDAIGSGSFTLIGSVPPQFRRGSDPGFILTAPNGLFFILSAGSGGAKFPDPNFNGNTYTLPITGGEARLIARVPLSLSAAFRRSSSELFIAQGNPGSGPPNARSSQVVRLNLVTGKAQPVVGNIPGLTGGVAFDGAGNLFAGIGFLPGRTGEIRRFDKEDVDEALRTAAPIAFAAGSFVTQSLDAAPMVFDSEDDLLVGGGDLSPGGQSGFIAEIDPRTGALLRQLDPEPGAAATPFFEIALDHRRGCTLAASDFFDPNRTVFRVNVCE